MSVAPIPSLPVPVPKTPWNISPQLFERVQDQNVDTHAPLKTCTVLSTDPEFAFIFQYFMHNKPHQYGIKKITCIHNADQTQAFEGGIKITERETENPVYAPQWSKEEPKQERAQTVERWRGCTTQFSPFKIKGSKRTDHFAGVKVLPLWHGSTAAVCQSIFSAGFTSFGKHHYFHQAAQEGGSSSTDIGYFGSGLYFTNSARYASMYSSGHLLLTWVSMREPYPVVNNVPHPAQGDDMKKLQGHGHYQNYNAHYIPVAPIKPTDPNCMEYYPCYKTQAPVCDEIVVFEKSQTLARFWIELSDDSPAKPLPSLETKSSSSGTSQSPKGAYVELLLRLLENPAIQSDAALSALLEGQAEELMGQTTQTLTPKQEESYRWVQKLLVDQKVSQFVARSLRKIHAPEEQKNPPAGPATPSIAPPKTSIVATPTLHPIAFGAAEWRKYFGDVGVEPPLPPAIDKVLSNPCPFWPGKKIHETHLLVLVPQTVNGQPLTLESLGALVQKPLQGHASEYAYCLLGQYTDPPAPRSRWVLITRNVIEGSRNKSYKDQQAVLASYSQKAHMPYVVPKVLDATVAIFMEHVRSGIKLYGDSPRTLTRCQEQYSAGWQLIVGGFWAYGLVVCDYGSDCEERGVGGSLEVVEGEQKNPPTEPSVPSIAPLKISVAATPAIEPSTPSIAPSKTSIATTHTLSPMAFGAAEWRKYFGDVGVEPPLPPAIGNVLNNPCPFWPGKKIHETHLLVLVPQTVNGQPLTLKSLGELVKKPLQGHASKYGGFFLGRYTDPPAPRSHWALVTRNVIEGSRNKNYQKQQAVLAGYNQKAHMSYVVPKILDVTVAIFMEHVRSGIKLYGDSYLTYTKCQQSYNAEWELVVGGFSAYGLRVCDDFHLDDAYGVGGSLEVLGDG